MSILNGSISSELLFPKKMPFGDLYEECGFIKLNGATDVGVFDDFIVCAGFGTLEFYKLCDTSEPKYISTLMGIGESRQLCIDSGFAYVSTRADGVFVCDIRNPEAPLITYHIDTLELATGISTSNGVLAITNRHMGCELYDVRDPYKPSRLGDFLCGEAQSVWLYERYAVIGDWMNKRIRIFDIAEPGNANEISFFGVDGFADGVCVYKSGKRLICLAATGHHSAQLKNRRKYQTYTYVTPEMISEGYGCGHGVEIFDITDPFSPEYLSSIKAPPMFGGMDSWRVYCDGKTCYFTDSMNGIFAIDLSDLTKPVFKHHFRLPPSVKQNFSPPSIQLQAGAISGAASIKGLLCAVSASDGLHILRSNEKVGEFVKASSGINFNSRKHYSIDSDEYRSFFEVGSQLHSFVLIDGNIYCACGESGIAVLDLDGKLKYIHKTPSICHDICTHKGFLLVAEGQSGIAAYKIGTTGLYELSRIKYGTGYSARELINADDSIVAELGNSHMSEISVCDDGILTKRGNPCNAGLLYHRHIARSASGKYICAIALSTGPRLFVRGDGGLKFTGYSLSKETCPFAEGACGYDGKLICILRGRYVCLDNPEKISLITDDDHITVEDANLNGMPFVCNNTLVILNRYNGKIELLDITDPHRPRFMKLIRTGLYPEFAAVINGRLFIACGHSGIIEIK